MTAPATNPRPADAAATAAAGDALPIDPAPAAPHHSLTRAWQLLTLAADRLRRECATELGISVTELNALAHLYRQGTMTVGHLAEALAMGVAGTTTVVDHLERAGYARRAPHPDDRRVRLVSLTPGGTHAAEWVIERSTEVVAPALVDCPPDEITRLTSWLQAMAAAMSV